MNVFLIHVLISVSSSNASIDQHLVRDEIYNMTYLTLFLFLFLF